MAFCIKCGSSLPDEAQFCPQCGTKRYDNKGTPKENISPTTQNDITTNLTTKNENKKPNKTAIIIIAIICIVILLIIVGVASFLIARATISSDKKDSITDYNSVEVADGFDESDFDASDEAVKVIKEIMDAEDYYEHPYDDMNIVFTDTNADDIFELYVTYYTKDDYVPRLNYQMWTFPNRAVCQHSNMLYEEVGGNSGEVGIAVSYGEIYFYTMQSSPTGSTFEDITEYTKLSDDGSLSDTDFTVMFASGIIGKESSGTYLVNNIDVSYSDYKKAKDEYYTMFSMPYGDSELVYTVEEFLNIYD